MGVLECLLAQPALAVAAAAGPQGVRTNDFQMFSETFERAVFIGHESQQINFRIASTGASVGTVAPSTETLGS